jgi:uncharacterized cupredoxin-like copper-binding protein
MSPNPLTRTIVVVGVFMAAVVAAVIVGLVAWSPPALGDVPVSLKDYSIRMSSKLTAGSHTFGITNDGKQPHELVVFRTDLAADALPVDADGRVDEESPELENVADSGDPLKVGGTEALETTLAPGHYVAVCNISDHYQRGMQLNLTVK